MNSELFGGRKLHSTSWGQKAFLIEREKQDGCDEARGQVSLPPGEFCLQPLVPLFSTLTTDF